jgi:hypothetical protein
VVELLPERAKRLGDVRVVDQPAELGIAFASDDDFGLEAVAVQAPAFVVRRQLRQ